MWNWMKNHRRAISILLVLSLFLTGFSLNAETAAGVSGKYSLRTPTISVKKGKSGKTKYITVSFKKYQGKFAEIYIAKNGDKYQKLKLVSNNIKKYHGKFKIQNKLSNSKIDVKVRTYEMKNKKRVYSDFSKECAVWTDLRASQIPKLSQSKLTLSKGKTAILKVKNYKKKILWSSAKKKVAIVTKKGVVKAKKQGTAVITAKVGKVKLKCKVMVTRDKAVSVNTPVVSDNPVEPPAVTEEPSQSPVVSQEPQQTEDAGNAGGTEVTEKPSKTMNPSTNAPDKGDNEKKEYAEDVVALTKIIEEQRANGATVSEDIHDSEQYVWIDGRLIYIYWDRKNLKGNLDLTGLSALGYISCTSNRLSQINISGMEHFWGLDCKNNSLTLINASDCINLGYLQCSNNQLRELNLEDCENLTNIYCSENQLKELNVNACTKLSELYCSNNFLTRLDVSNFTSLVILECYYNHLEKLNINGCSQLVEFRCYGNYLEELDLSNAPRISNLYCYNNKLKELIVTNIPALKNFQCHNNQLTKLELSGCEGLEYLYCQNNQLEELNVNNCTALTGFT